jgi:hypothetical protein
MEFLLTTMALTLPMLLGGLWLNLIVPPKTIARTALVWGSGTLIGLILIPQFMWGLDALGTPLSFWAPASVTGALIGLAVLAGVLWKRPAQTAHPEIRALSTIPASQQALFVFLLILVGLRLTTLGLEVLWRPLFPWDATMHWATKARVWFEFQSMVPFVENAAWLNTGGDGVFTDHHPSYPPTIPLLQVWMNMATGHWDESLMNLPWLLCFIALGSTFYGQLRFSGTGPAIAMAFTYFLLSMPLINTHVALAGYADLFLGAAYCGALMSFHNWVSTKQRWQFLLMLLFVIACPLIKIEGYMWSLTIIPGLVVALATRRVVTRIGVLAVTVVVVLATLMLYRPDSIDQTLYLLTGFNMEALLITGIDMKALLAVVKSVWLHDNWHLFGYLLPASIALSLMLPRVIASTYRGIAIALTSAVVLYLFLFLFTLFSAGAKNFTGVGRLGIQLTPALLYLSALLCNEILARGGVRSVPETADATQ